jgi:ribonuclease T2
MLALFLLVALSTIWPRREETASPPVAPQQSQAVRAAADNDHYVLALSWSPTHCASDEGRGRDDDGQCRSGRAFGFVLHGLWPQHENDYPENCPSREPERVPEEIVSEVLNVTPSRALIQHEWRRHGTCSGLTQRDYFAAATAAFGAVEIPSRYRSPPREIATTADDVRAAFLSVNSQLQTEGVTVVCRRSELAEVRLCLDTDLQPRACSPETRKRHCGTRTVKMRAVRGNWPR